MDAVKWNKLLFHPYLKTDLDNHFKRALLPIYNFQKKNKVYKICFKFNHQKVHFSEDVYGIN